jgi:hypothetical protein
MFVLGRPTKSLIMFVSKARPNSNGIPFKHRAPLQGRLLDIATNITQGWIGLPGTNTVTSLSAFVSYEEKKIW